jgi:hypothetical protein
MLPPCHRAGRVVLTLRPELFALGAIRDLLRIVRVLSSAWLGQDSKVTRCRELRRIREPLRAARKLPAPHEFGTLGHAAAWKRGDAGSR